MMLLRNISVKPSQNFHQIRRVTNDSLPSLSKLLSGSTQKHKKNPLSDHVITIPNFFPRKKKLSGAKKSDEKLSDQKLSDVKLSDVKLSDEKLSGEKRKVGVKWNATKTRNLKQWIPDVKSLPSYKPLPNERNMFPEVVYPYPNDPPSGRESDIPENHSSTWLHPRPNDGHGSDAYQLQNFHWEKENAFDLDTLNEFRLFLHKLDSGDFPSVVILSTAALNIYTKNFCPGADLIEIYKQGAKYGREFYKAAYEVCYLLATMRKPTFPIIQGETLGLGAGLTLHSLFRVVSENGLWGMPNTLYGAFPDCGTTWFLPRLDGEVGMYLALTGRRVEASDVLRLGIATHFIPSQLFNRFEQDTASFRGEKPMEELMEIFKDLPQQPEGGSAILHYEDIINRCFSKFSLEEVFHALEKEKDPWAQRVIKRLNLCSPLMLHVTFRLQRIGRYLETLGEALQLEYRVALHMLESKDFYSGIGIRMLKKNFIWEHKDIFSVPNKDIAKFFTEHPREKDLNLQPCHPGYEPSCDPFRIYLDEIDYKMNDNMYNYKYLMLKQLDNLLPPKQQTASNLAMLYKILMKQGGIESEAARYLYKAEATEYQQGQALPQVDAVFQKPELNWQIPKKYRNLPSEIRDYYWFPTVEPNFSKTK